MCGGAGSGLIACAVLSGMDGSPLALALLAGVVLVGAGLTCVWLEIGRPLRALHVFINPRTSWMTREAFVATLLIPASMAAALGLPGVRWLAALLALAFVYCQGRMLRAARGIPAWRATLTLPGIVLTGLAEGAGWLLLLALLAGFALPPVAPWVMAALLVARALVWRAHRQNLAAQAAPLAMAALHHTGRWLLWLGTALPLAALLLAATAGGTLAPPLLALAGVAAAGAGAWFKFVLVTRAGFNQGFALRHLPVRGVAR
jgi:phenylacetyl-CoA:acceptor oxidoreductase subunit 2